MKQYIQRKPEKKSKNKKNWDNYLKENNITYEINIKRKKEIKEDTEELNNITPIENFDEPNDKQRQFQQNNNQIEKERNQEKKKKTQHILKRIKTWRIL